MEAQEVLNKILDGACPSDMEASEYELETHCLRHTLKAHHDSDTGHWTVTEMTTE